MLYLLLCASVVVIFMPSPWLRVTSAFVKSPEPETSNLFFSAWKDMLSLTMSMSSIASFKDSEGSSIIAFGSSFGTLCSFSSKSINGKSNVLVLFAFRVTFSLLSAISRLNTSLPLALLKTCFKLPRFNAITSSFFIEYSAKDELGILNITMATLAGSMATSSNTSLEILNLASVTRSDIMLMLSFNSFGSASVSFKLYHPLKL